MGSVHLTMPGRFDHEALRAELGRAVATIGSDTPSPGAIYHLRSLLREAEAVCCRGSEEREIGRARLALARASWESGARDVAIQDYRRLVAGTVRHRQLLEQRDLELLSAAGEWATVLAALSRTPREERLDLGKGVLLYNALRGLGRESLASWAASESNWQLSTDAATGLMLLKAIDGLLHGLVESWLEGRFGDTEPPWSDVITALLEAFLRDDRTALVLQARKVADLAGSAPAAVAELALALCSWLALSADPLADDASLGLALTSFLPSSPEGAKVVQQLAAAYDVPLPASGHSAPKGELRPSAAFAGLDRLAAARVQLLAGRREQAVETLGPQPAAEPALSLILRQVIEAHARFGDAKPRPVTLLMRSLDRSIEMWGVAASATVTVRELLVLGYLRTGNVTHAATELMVWDLTDPTDRDVRPSRWVLAHVLVALGGAPVRKAPQSALGSSRLGWRSQARLLDTSRTVLDEQVEGLGQAHPTVVARKLLDLDAAADGATRAFATESGQMADWMFAHGYNAFHRVLSLRVGQGDCLLRVGDVSHASRVLTYAAERLDALVPEATGTRSRARLLLARSLIAGREFEAACSALSELEPATAEQAVAAGYLTAVARQGSGDLEGAREALERIGSDQGDLRGGVSAGAVRRRLATVERLLGDGHREGLR